MPTTRTASSSSGPPLRSKKENLFDYALISAISGMGPVKGDKLEGFIKSKIPVANIENLKLPYAAVATDLNRGTRGDRPRAHRQGGAGELRHPRRVPARGPPGQAPRGRRGGGQYPHLRGAEKGADIVIAVDISENVTNFNITNMFDVMLQAVNIMFNENVVYKKKDADVLIIPAVGDVGMLDFTQKKRCMQAGIEATQKAMPEIKKKIEEWALKKTAKK